MTAYVPPPDGPPPAFPGAQKVKPKTVFGGGGKRRRWRDGDRILEWDYAHGRVEMYDSKGNHLGEFDPETGARVKEADPRRKVEP